MSLSTLELWNQFSVGLRGFINRRVRDPQDAEDLLQEVFVRVHEHLAAVQHDGKVAGWLYQIARNLIRDYYRRLRPTSELSDSLAAEETSDENNAELEIAQSLAGMLDCLPGKYHQALRLTELDGVSQVELAKQLGISASGAKSRVQRGRVMLRQLLLDCCHFEFDRRGNLIEYASRCQCCAAECSC